MDVIDRAASPSCGGLAVQLMLILRTNVDRSFSQHGQNVGWSLFRLLLCWEDKADRARKTPGVQCLNRTN